MKRQKSPDLPIETYGIGLENESTLHSDIKNWYRIAGDRLEAKVDGYIIDIVRNNILIEIQTKNFAAIRPKLRKLLVNHPVRLVYPVAVELIIKKISPIDRTVLNSRKSNKKGKTTDIFDELIRIPDLIGHENLTIEILLIREEQMRCDDGKGSWRRKGTSIIDKRLLEVLEKKVLNEKKDYLDLLLEYPDTPFTNKHLASQLGIPINKVRKITYCMRKANILKEAGKIGNAFLYTINAW